MMVRFKRGELLQHGRGIGGLLRLVKSVFKPLVRTAGKTIVKLPNPMLESKSLRI